MVNYLILLHLILLHGVSQGVNPDFHKASKIFTSKIGSSQAITSEATHFSGGISSLGTRSLIERDCPGILLISPFSSSLSII